ncbi:DUF1592 domain-containing protein [Planctomicrobium sp. SH661]|uniref:DUF1592 domain-containing protein n=1 Tax=Planctomicrobium sp. SH661 TaxID=3448124 RepID=UPI003F5BA186
MSREQSTLVFEFRLARILRCLTMTAVVGIPLLSSDSGLSLADDAPAAPHDTLAKGAEIYANLCAKCHGPAGEGTSDYPTGLTGDKSIPELARLIDETMPEGEPELCSAEEAKAVAEYIHETFYSPLAQERNRPATVEFSRLTVRQFENSVTDLYASFRGGPNQSKEQGLKSSYYNLRWFDKSKLVFERVEPTVNFDFGSKKPEGFPEEPDKEKRASDDIHDDQEFSIAWSGSLLAPETGDYDLIVESENGVRLYLNDHHTPLCDAWVSSGTEKIHSNTIHLLGGRRYPLRLEFFRYKQPTASIRLKWKRPGRPEEVIPARFLFAEMTPPLFVFTTAFPPDDRSVGYERGNSVSKGWQDAVVQASLETADDIASRLNSLAGIGENDTEAGAKVKAFCQKFVERAFRRPLTPEDVAKYIDTPLANVPSDIGVKRVVLLTLMSPKFLYREHGLHQFDSYAMASWLSYTLWDSIPDQPLLEAAARNELQTREQVSAQVDRMLDDPRSLFKLSQFFRQWLRLDHMPEIVKNQDAYAGFDAALVADLRSSLELFLDELLRSPEADFRQLFLEDSMYMNGSLARFYGAELPAETDFQKVTFQPDLRAGVLTHPLLLSGFAYDQESSPIHRGVFIARSLLGRRLKPPPEAVAPLAPDLHAGLTTRARVLLQTSPNSCQTCHSMINDLGFSLEHFDAAGRYRLNDKDQPVDAQGGYLNKDGTEVSFVGSRELSEFLVASPEVHEAFTEQLFQYTIRQPIRAFGEDELPRLTAHFAQENFNIRRLLKEIAIDSAMKMREIEERAPSTAAAPAGPSN